MPATKTKKQANLRKADIELINRALVRLVYDEEMELVRFAREHFVVGSDGKSGFQYFQGKTFADLKKYVDENPEAGKWHSLSVLERLRDEVAALKKKINGE